MGNEQVNLSTEHQYWRVMRDFVEPAVREFAESESASGLVVNSESLVLRPEEKYYSFDISLRDHPADNWCFNYVLERDTEQVRMEAVRLDRPYMEPIVLGTRSVDDYDSEKALDDIRENVGRVLHIEGK